MVLGKRWRSGSNQVTYRLVVRCPCLDNPEIVGASAPAGRPHKIGLGASFYEPGTTARYVVRLEAGRRVARAATEATLP
jgi:hypothetical protein